MKISKLFHWLYASLMFLPLLVAPIFAIYSHRHQINDYVIQVEDTKAVDFNQQFKSFSVEPYMLSINDYTFTLDNSISSSSYVQVFSHEYVNHKVLYKVKSDVINFRTTNDGFPYLSNADLYSGFESIITLNQEANVYFVNTLNDTDGVSTITLNVIDLTQMFGVGNEPTLQDFNTWYAEDFYPYTLSHRELLKTGNYITYDDTDIGSQFLYDLYNTTDKYLNFDSVLNLYQVNDWINLNVFNGSVPLVWYIIWHYLDYWLLLSIFWLCFDVLIYVPQLAHRWLDKASLE